MTTLKEPVRLRKRLTPLGNYSLYLDIYQRGHRSYEYLRLYLIPEKTREDKETNRKTLQFAEAIRAKRVVELRNNEYGFKNTTGADVRFFDYYEAMCEKRLGAESKGNWGNWLSCLKHLRIYEKREYLTFADINQEWVRGFKDYLENKAIAWNHGTRHVNKEHKLSRNSRLSYFNKLRACFNQALNDGVIEKNPMQGVDNFSAEDVARMYLTIDELRTLVDTPCERESVRKAFLFSCLTGLRRSDIERLKWKDVFEHGGFTRIIFRQKKTKGQEYLDINEQATELMGKRGKDDWFVFDDFFAPESTNRCLQNWVYRAGIDKRITFHCGRHTFAVLMLDVGTDIYTVSKLLGHRSLSTTQIYAKVLDKNKQAAVSNIPKIF